MVRRRRTQGKRRRVCEDDWESRPVSKNVSAGREGTPLESPRVLRVLRTSQDGPRECSLGKSFLSTSRVVSTAPGSNDGPQTFRKRRAYCDLESVCGVPQTGGSRTPRFPDQVDTRHLSGPRPTFGTTRYPRDLSVHQTGTTSRQGPAQGLVLWLGTGTRE